MFKFLHMEGFINFAVIKCFLFFTKGRRTPFSPNYTQQSSYICIYSMGHVKPNTPLSPGLAPYCTSLQLCSQHAWRVV